MRRSPFALSLVLLVVGAAALWASSRIVWLTVHVSAEQLGEQTRTLTGGTWSPESTAVALGLLATAAVLLFTRGLVARIVAVVALLLAVLGGISGVLALGGGVDTSRVHSVLTATDGVARTSGSPSTEGGTVPEWAEVTDATANPAGPAVAVAGALLALAGAAVAVIRPRPPTRRADRYRTPGELRREAEAAEAVGELGVPAVGGLDGAGSEGNGEADGAAGSTGSTGSDLAAEPSGASAAGSEPLSEQDADRLLWDSLDAGDDPTDATEPPRSV